MKTIQNNSKQFKTILLTLSVLFVISCEKGEEQKLNKVKEDVTQSNFIQANQIAFYKNSSNIYDYYGDFHNQGCDLLINNLPTLNVDSIFHFLDEFSTDFESNYFGISKQDCIERLNHAKHQIETMAEAKNGDVFLMANSLISQWNSSVKCKEYGYSLITLLSNNRMVNDSATFINIINQIKSIEASVISDQNITDNERAGLLRTSSILRHSIYYWANNFPEDINDVARPKWIDKLVGWFKKNQTVIVAATADVLTAITLTANASPFGDQAPVVGTFLVSVLVSVLP